MTRLPFRAANPDRYWAALAIQAQIRLRIEDMQFRCRHFDLNCLSSLEMPFRIDACEKPPRIS